MSSPRPLRSLLEATPSEATLHRLWRRVGARRAERARQATRRRAALAAFTLAAACAALVWIAAGRLGRGGEVARPGPVLFADGREIAALEAEGAPRVVPLSDGSTLTLDPGARLAPLESTASAFALLLERGSVDFQVKKGGPRRWTIECGLATIEVTGTRFRVDRSGASVRVAVSEGVVLVRGERVPDRVRRLAAGDQIEITALAEAAEPPRVEAPRAGASSADPPIPAPRSSAGAAIAPAPTPRRASPSPSWRDLATRGDYAEAYQALGAGGIAGEASGSDVDDLLLLADVARRSGHAAEAVAPLARIVVDHRADGRAALASFTLGRLQLDTLGAPAPAAKAFSEALSLGLPPALVEDARARLVEAHARAGDAESARAAAAAYTRAYPEGRYTAAVRRWAEGP